MAAAHALEVRLGFGVNRRARKNNAKPRLGVEKRYLR
jgi:hypothetical protein